MSVNCAFCALDYSFVGKTERLPEDLVRAMELAGGDGGSLIPPGLKLGLHANAMPKMDNKTAHYFRKLSREVASRLHELYRIDFEMFGYSPDLYLNL